MIERVSGNKNRDIGDQTFLSVLVF